MSGYAVLKPKTPYQTEDDCPIKFGGGEDFTLDEAVRHIAESGTPFRMANLDLLEYALRNTPPRNGRNAPGKKNQSHGASGTTATRKRGGVNVINIHNASAFC